MNSFPTRITRSQLGPQFRDVYPVENPETDIGGDQFNGLFDQVAGCNVIVSRAALVASWNGSAFDVLHQAEAWNTDNSQPHPALARSAIGRYTYLFAASYLDSEGNAVTTALPAARADSFRVPVDEANPYASRIARLVWKDPANPLNIKLAFFDSAGAAIDVPFWLEVL